MKDFLGNELEIGDIVAVTRNPYSQQWKRFVIGFSPKGIRVSITKDGEQEGNVYFSRQTVKVFNQNER